MRSLVIASTLAAALPAAADVQQVGQIEGLGEVFFEFDSARPANIAGTLDEVAAWAKSHRGMTIVLDGHADSAGSATYNVALAARRADAVRARLVAKGVDAERIVIVTYGEDGLRRSSNDLDRRVTVWATAAPLYAVVDQSLTRGTAVMWNKPVSETALVAPRATQVSIR